MKVSIGDRFEQSGSIWECVELCDDGRDLYELIEVGFTYEGSATFIKGYRTEIISDWDRYPDWTKVDTKSQNAKDFWERIK